MTRRLRHEDGWAVVTAMMVMVLMMGLGVSTYPYVDSQVQEALK